MKTQLAFAALLALVGVQSIRADLKRALAETNLEKRSRLALENAKAAYQQVQTFATEIEQSVDLAYQSLQQTGKNPRSSPRYFKSAEQETSQLMRRIEGLQEEMSYTERPMLDKTKARVQQVHDDLLLGLMEGRKK
jgi:hypothetical protein